MIWLLGIIGGVACLVFAKKSNKLGGFLACVIPAIGAGLITFIVSSCISANIEAFWRANETIYMQAVVKTNSAVIVHNASGPMDLGIQLENNSLSGKTADRIREWRDRIVDYNESLTWFNTYRKYNWITWPFFVEPDISCKIIGIK